MQWLWGKTQRYGYNVKDWAILSGTSTSYCIEMKTVQRLGDGWLERRHPL
jgi:hypothetical protein